MSVTVQQVRTRISDKAQIWPGNAEPPELLGIADGVQTIFSLRFENFIPGTLTIYESAPPPAGSGIAPVWTAIDNTAAAVATMSTNAVNAGFATIVPLSMANISLDTPLVVDEPPHQEVIVVNSESGSAFGAIFVQAHNTASCVVGAPAYQVGSPNETDTSTLASNATITFAKPPTAGQMIGARYQATAFSDVELSDFITVAQQTYPDDSSILKCVQYNVIDTLLMDIDRMTLIGQGEFKRDPRAYQQGLVALKASLRTDLAGMPNPGANTPQMFVGVSPTAPYQPQR